MAHDIFRNSKHTSFMNVQENLNLCQEFRFYKNLDGSSPKNLVTQKKKRYQDSISVLSLSQVQNQVQV